MSQPAVSIILPCYRAATTAGRTVAELIRFFESYRHSFEIIVVDDGGGDFAGGSIPDDPRVKLLRLPVNTGKGGAIAAGMLEARGRARVFTDIDVPYGPAAIAVAAEYVLERQFHMVIGDRTMRASSYSHASTQRHLASGVFAKLVGILVTGGFFDTQCGLKAFRGDVADAVFRLVRLKGYAFDVEVVYLALRYHADIKRMPVHLFSNERSSIKVGHDSVRMLLDVLRIKLFQLRGYYDDTALARIVSEDFERVSAAALANRSGEAIRETGFVPE